MSAAGDVTFPRGFEPLLAAPARRIGMGFCRGGPYAPLAACSVRGLFGCVSFYGIPGSAEKNERKPRSPLDAAADLWCPYLGIFGKDDALIPGHDVAHLGEHPAAAGKTFEINRYLDAGHAFRNHSRPDAYPPQAAIDAFERALGFFEALSGGR
jgi:carboxymethylenebutenolidase